MNKSLCKTPQIYLISWCGNFMERHSFRIVLGHLPETMGKLCLSTQFPHQKIRWNYGILRRELNSKVTCFIKAFYKYNSVWYYWWSRIWNNRLIRLWESQDLVTCRDNVTVPRTMFINVWYFLTCCFIAQKMKKSLMENLIFCGGGTNPPSLLFSVMIYQD